MSHRQSGWMSSSVSRPTAFNSPNFTRLSDVKGRLSFSAAKTPAFKPKQRSLVDTTRNGSLPLNGYHMSKQNPDVLDRLCSPSPSHRDHLLHKKTLTPTTVRVGGRGGGVVIGKRNGHSALQSSLVKQMLNDKHRAPASLVHLATRGKSFRSGVNTSPVVVKLSGAAPQSIPSNSSSSSNSSQEENKTPESRSEVSSKSSDGEATSGKKVDPCDKNVVLSALRQRRKRWATSAPDDDHNSSSSGSAFSGAPSAKRTKHSAHPSESHGKSPLSFIVGDRKRAYTAPSYSMSPDSKKSRFSLTSVKATAPSTSDKVAPPEIESDRGSEVSEQNEAERESGMSSKTSSRAPSECVGSFDGDSVQGRSLTPPIQFDEAEINRKREESLNSLKAVFSPKGDEKKPSNRRKLPVFCATGTKPHLPTPLSTSHSVTQEDLKKDREAAAAKLRGILAAEEEPSLKSDSTSSLPTQVPPLSSALGASTSKDILSNSVPGLRLSSTLSGSLPSLPSASSTSKTSLPSTIAPNLSSLVPPSTTLSTSTTAISAGVTSSVLPTGAPSAPLAPSAAKATATSSQQTQSKSVSFAPLPVPSPASTAQTGFPFPLSTATSPAAGQPAITNASTSLTGAQPSQLSVAPVSAAATSVSGTSSSFALATTSMATQLSSTPGLVLGQAFNQEQSTGLSLPGSTSGGIQLGLLQGTALSASTSTASAPTALTTTPVQPGSIFGAPISNSITAPTTTTSGGIKFALPPITQQQPPPLQPQQQPSGLSLQTTNPSLSVGGSSAANGSNLFGLKSSLQTTTTSSAQSSSSGIVFGVQPQPPQQPQASQLSLFGGAQQVQSSKSSNIAGGGGISFNFSQQPSVVGGSGVGGFTASGSTGLNLTAAPQQSQAPGDGLKISNFSFSANSSANAQQKPTGLTFPGSSQSSSGSGLSLFNKSVNPLQQQSSQQPSIFSGGSGPAGGLQANQSNGLFSGQQQQQTSSGFPGFKLSSATSGGSQPQTSQTLSIFGNTNSATTNSLIGGSSGGLSFTGGQGGVGGATGVGSGFPSLNASAASGGGLSTGFNFSAAASNGSGLFQNASAPSSQSGNPLAALAGSQQPKSGVSFNFSANALASQQQSQGTGTFPFGQNTASSGGINFPSSGGSTGIGIGNQTQNGSSGFNFSAGAGMGMNSGAKSTSGIFNNNSTSSIFQSPLQQQQSSAVNVFQTPQTQKQLSFTATPTNQPNTPAPGGVNFQTNSSFSFSAGAGTPGGSSARPMARARRRKK